MFTNAFILLFTITIIYQEPQYSKIKINILSISLRNLHLKETKHRRVINTVFFFYKLPFAYRPCLSPLYLEAQICLFFSRANIPLTSCLCLVL